MPSRGTSQGTEINPSVNEDLESERVIINSENKNLEVNKPAYESEVEGILSEKDGRVSDSSINENLSSKAKPATEENKVENNSPSKIKNQYKPTNDVKNSANKNSNKNPKTGIIGIENLALLTLAIAPIANDLKKKNR